MKIKPQPKLSRRASAALIDYGLYFAFYVWFIVTYGEPNGDGGHTIEGLGALWTIIVWFLYFPLPESIWGQTLGKRILGLRVVTMNGNSISFGQAFKRHLLDCIDIFSGIVGLIAIKYTPTHQRLGDLVAKTIVIGGESFDCPRCRAELTLSVEEVINGQFTCPQCRAIVKPASA